MKRLLIAAVFLFSSISYAGWIDDNYGIDVINISTRTIGATNVTLTIPKAGSNVRNCLTDITFSANVVTNFTIIDGALTAPTTLYTVAVSSGVPYQEHWSTVPLCSAPNSTMSVVATNYLGKTHTAAVTITYSINAQGVTRSRP